MKKYLSLKKRIKNNEGYRSSAYKDQLGFLTIGYGHLIKHNEKDLLKKKYSKKFLINVFEIDFNKALKDYKKNYRKYKFHKNIEEVLIEMIFQLGIEGQKKFKKKIKYLIKKQPYMASLEMLESLWYKQTPKRVKMLIKTLIKTA